MQLSNNCDSVIHGYPIQRHDFCETVRVALCAFKKGHPVLVVAEESFQFVQDEAYDAAQFLATCAGNQQALNFTRFLDRSRPPAADVEFLDEKVTLAFRHLKLPAEWNVLGADQSLNGHDFCETVRVALCAFKKGHPVLVVAEESFQFVQDEAYDAAQFLATCAGNQQALNFTRFLDRSRPPAADVEFLDEKVTLAFRHLKLPAEWNVLGADQSLNENIPRETLMHFAARLGLLRLTWFLLQQPGGRGALSIRNTEGATPVTLALERGYQKLHQLLTE
nr:PREDICTED: A-kinase anchor protein 13-like [Apteryx mantelli mantelli]